MDERKLLAWTRLRAHYLAAVEFNRDCLAIKEEGLDEEDRRRLGKDRQVMALVLHLLEQRHSAGWSARS
jgi:hypothetical protein